MSKILVERPASSTRKPALSSNWKILQKTLKRKSDDAGTKSESHQQVQPEKRIKQDIKSTKSKILSSKTYNPNAAPFTTKIKTTGKSSAMAGDDTKTPATSATLALWAEDNDISASDLAQAYGVSTTSTELPVSAMQSLELDNSKKTEIGKYVAMDCEMVGVGGPDHERSVLARVSIVNFHGHCVLDVFVRPQERVTDWRTWVSGVSAKDMVDAVDFPTAQKMVSDVLKDRILIGHAIRHDLGVLLLSQSHPQRDIRDTSKHVEFRKISKGKTPGLKRLAKEILGIDIQGGEHSSVEDARACMLLYRRHKADFERHHAIQYPNRSKQPKGKSRANKKKTSKSTSEKSGSSVKDEGGDNVTSFLEI